MISKAVARFQRISPRKARVVVSMIRGRDASEALQLLDFTPKAGAPIVRKLIQSALANASGRVPEDAIDSLYIKTAFVNEGPNQHMRRWRPRAHGRATRIIKGMSHIHIELDQR